MASEHDDPAERASIGSSPDLNRAVYERFLSSDYPEALRLADLVLERDPLDSVARAVRAQCIEALASETVAEHGVPGTLPPETLESPLPALHPNALMRQDDASVEELGDDDILLVEGDDGGLDQDDVITETETAPYVPVSTEDPTSPTLSLDDRGDVTREVYRRFLASEYAPALELAETLLAAGHDDSMLTSIARECRAALDTRSSIPAVSADPGMVAHLVEGDVDPRAAAIVSRVDGRMTIEQVAEMSGMPLDDVVGLLERFVAMGVITLRPPPSMR